MMDVQLPFRGFKGSTLVVTAPGLVGPPALVVGRGEAGWPRPWGGSRVSGLRRGTRWSSAAGHAPGVAVDASSPGLAAPAAP